MNVAFLVMTYTASNVLVYSGELFLVNEDLLQMVAFVK